MRYAIVYSAFTLCSLVEESEVYQPAASRLPGLIGPG